MLKRIGYTMREIKRLNVLRAIDQIMFFRTDELLPQSELLQAHGVRVFDKRKGLPRYIEFFDSVEAKSRARRERYQEEIRPVRIDPVKTFMEG